MRPRVLIVATGGTIASHSNAPILEGSELIQATPELTDYANVEVEEFTSIGSYELTPEHWLNMVKHIHDTLSKKPDLACVIITHGTDTMEETAFFLNLTHKNQIPIVLVGAMRYSNAISADGPANLINAVRVGISNDAIGKGVLVVMNDNINAGRDLLKMHNHRVDAFPSTELGFIGFVDPEKVTFYRSPSKPHTEKSDFDVYKLDSLPEVDILKDFTGLDSDVLSFFLARSTQGLVISTMAGGRFSKAVNQVIDLPKNDKPIVISSSIRSGRIMGSHSSSYPNSPLIVANDLPPNKARILLMLALTKTSDIGQIQAYFEKY